MFRRIVQALMDDVAASRLPVGARLPAHRDLADDLHVARGTVARAYGEAERLGLVRSEVGRGTHVLAPDGGSRPYSSLLEAPTAISDLSTNLPLSGIDPDPGDALRRLADRPDRRSLFRYLSPFGLQRHRVAGVAWLRLMGITAAAEELLLCAGAQHALYITLAHLASRARAIYVEELTYPGMHAIAEALRLPLIPVGVDEEGMTVRALERACGQHGPGVVYCMPTLHNPLGAVMSAARREAIARVAHDRDLFLVEDAANRMLLAHAPPPLRDYAPDRTFVVASVSKILLPGLRVAFLAGPAKELAALARQVWATQWMVSPIGAEIVAMWLEEGVVERTLRGKRREARRRQAALRRLLGRDNIQAHPQALHTWLTWKTGWSAERFAALAGKERIVVTPASAFWTRRSAPPRAVRVALGGVDDIAELERGLTKLGRLVNA